MEIFHVFFGGGLALGNKRLLRINLYWIPAFDPFHLTCDSVLDAFNGLGLPHRAMESEYLERRAPE